MGKYYISIKYKTLMALINFVVLEHGFIFRNGKNHNKLISTSGASFPIPHKHPYTSPGFIEGVCRFLLQEGVKDSEIAKYVL